jgi:ABC-2 type transport system ATP-binding protein
MPILEVKNIIKKLAKKEVLHGVSFSVEPGEIYGFLGPNGAGKTTTMKCIQGLLLLNQERYQYLETKDLPEKRKKR